jgi:hypothetical protein
MNIVTATKEFETWLGQQTPLNRADLATKHEDMSSSAFSFMRATFYRWAQLWPRQCKALSQAPVVLAVGDLHVENFGTWRDSEGRLVWGVNDFDETCPMSFANDLVRLAVSASMAIQANHLTVSLKDACQGIAAGYAESLKAGGKPFVLAEEHAWLREPALGALRDPAAYWKKLNGLPTVKDPIPDSATEALGYALPNRDIKYRVVHRVAGEGSLGRLRYVALAEFHGGWIAREAKALVPSAHLWAQASVGPYEIHSTTIRTRGVRCRDPFLNTRGQWVVRRLAPDCSRIELAQLAPIKDEVRLMHAMGWETANIHLGTPDASKNVRAHLAKLPKNWLVEAAEVMEDAVVKDWKAWRKSRT